MKAPQEYSVTAVAGLLVFILLAPVLQWGTPLEFYIPASSWFARRFYSEIFVNKAPIDILFVGSSGTRLGIDPDIIRSEYRKHYGESINVVSIGVPNPGNDLIEKLFEEILARRKVRLVVRSLWGCQTSMHRYFVKTVGPTQLFYQWPQLGFRERMMRTARMFYISPALLFAKMLPATVNPKDRRLVRGRDYAIKYYRMGFDKEHGIEQFEKFKKDVSIPTTELEATKLSKNNFYRPSRNCKRTVANLVEFAKKHGFRLVLHRENIFSMSSHLKIPMKKKYFQKLDFLGVTDERFNAHFEKQNRVLIYADKSHFNANGAAIYSKMLSGPLFQRL